MLLSRNPHVVSWLPRLQVQQKVSPPHPSASSEEAEQHSVHRVSSECHCMSSKIGYTTDKPVHPVLYTFLPVFVNVTGNDYGLLSVTPGPVGVPKLLAVPGKVCTSQRKNIASSKRGCWEA